jgi:hypothetical protein
MLIVLADYWRVSPCTYLLRGSQLASASQSRDLLPFISSNVQRLLTQTVIRRQHHRFLLNLVQLNLFACPQPSRRSQPEPCLKATSGKVVGAITHQSNITLQACTARASGGLISLVCSLQILGYGISDVLLGIVKTTNTGV